jgi:4-amino-4-deoxy-L-arabinose transferase
MLDNKRFYIFLAFYFACLLIPAYWVPLIETTDARYAEISREMFASGNYMEPFYNGIKHFHKPPFTYWANALGIAIFGVNGLGVRFFGAVASIIILIYTRKTAFVLSNDKKIADTSVLILASSFLYLIVSRVVSTDIYLAMFTIMTLYHMFSQIYVKKNSFNPLMIGIFLGLGFMTKGPVIFLFTLLPYAASLFFDRKHRQAFSLLHWVSILAVFVLIATPWYWYVVSINDGLLEYFLYDQTVERVATDKFDRAKPFYFFFMIFFGTFIPWAFYMLRNYTKTNKILTGKVLYLYVLMPFIVFQISTSKLGTYILPFYPVAAILAALCTDSKLLKKLSLAVLYVLPVAMAVIPFVLHYMRPYWYICVPAGVAYMLLVIFLHKRYYDTNFVAAFTVGIVLMVMFVYLVMPLAGPYAKGYRMVAKDIQNFDPEGKYPVLIYETFVPSLSFYLNKVVPIAMSRHRETQFQEREEYQDILITNEEELRAYLDKNKEFILLVRKEFFYDAFVNFSGYECETISLRGEKKYTAFCKSPDISE